MPRKTSVKNSLQRDAGDSVENRPSDGVVTCARLHFSVGWWSLLMFLTLGIGLEVLHGFKLDWFLNVEMETRRLMWRLAHAHGTLLALVNLAFGGTALWASAWPANRRSTASYCLLLAVVLMPAGFFLGGLFIYDGDPGLGIVLVPVGALLLFVAVLLTAWEVSFVAPGVGARDEKIP